MKKGRVSAHVHRATLWRQLALIQKRGKPHLYALIFLETVCAGLLPLLLAFAPKLIIDYLTLRTGETSVVQTILLLFGLSMVLTVLSLLCNLRFDGAFVELRMKELDDLYKKHQCLDYQYLEDPIFSNRVQVALDALSSPKGFEHVYRNFIKLCPSLLSTLLLCILLSTFEPLIALVCVLTTLISVWLNQKITDYIRLRQGDKAKATRQKYYFSKIGYDFTYGKDIRIFNLAEKLNEAYQEKSDDFLGVVQDVAGREVRFGLRTVLLIFIKDLFAFLMVIYSFLSGALTLGEVSLYIGIILALSEQLSLGVKTALELTKSTTLAKAYFDFMDDDSVFSTYGNQAALAKDETLEIEFRDVSFRYPNTDRWILRHFDLKIEKGEKLAIVGVNGAGKTTIIKLLTRLFPVTEGVILVNGIPIDQFSREAYSDLFAAVYQDVNIFACSVLENVVGGVCDAGERERGAACLNCVGLAEKLKTLPNQYDTQLLKIIDDEGVELSGGQKQKLAISRALYKKANMIILDEPTAALDALAESEIYQSFNRLVGDKTAVYISHRLSSTKFCDKILLFSPEGILEYGNHAELMERHGAYFHIFQTQGNYYREEAEHGDTGA